MLHYIYASLLALPAFAAQDSVGVFHSPAKVVVQVNEAGAVSRLQRWMDWAGAANELELLSSDQSLRIRCARNADAATCTFRFLPSAKVSTAGRAVRADFSLADLGLSPRAAFGVDFESSRADRFFFASDGAAISFVGTKRR